MSGVDYNEEETLFDGESTPVVKVLGKAWTTGDVKCLSALDQYAFDSGDKYINETVLHLRRTFNKPRFLSNPASDGNIPDNKISDKALSERFERLKTDEKIKLLRDSIAILVGEQDEKGKPLFSHKYDWVPVLLVLKQRLNQRFTNDTFYSYANEITPSDLPDKLKISKSTMGNSTSLNIHDGPYYEWTSKQLEDRSTKHVHTVCCRFWDLVKRRLYEIS